MIRALTFFVALIGKADANEFESSCGQGCTTLMQKQTQQIDCGPLDCGLDKFCYPAPSCTNEKIAEICRSDTRYLKCDRCKSIPPAPDPTPAPTFAAEPFVCASGEGETCKCAGTVYYGKKYVTADKPGSGSTTSLPQLLEGGFRAKAAGGSIECSYTKVGDGVDPAYGWYKYCMCDNTPQLSHCADEHAEDAYCNCDGGVVVYGRKYQSGDTNDHGHGLKRMSLQALIPGKFKAKSGNQLCSNGNFGGDPDPKWYKHCLCLK